MKIKLYLVIIYLLVSGIVYADGGASTGIIWPGWRVETSEDFDTPGYPISFMFDGSAQSAWVHHFAPNPNSFETLPQNPTPHGIGTTITISQDDQQNNERNFFTIDGLGIINGYAKDSDIYKRNNRISTIQVSLLTKDGNWSKSFSLKESLKMQRISFPRQSVSKVTIKITKVDEGKDDDLCISELAIYDKGVPKPWNMTPVMLYNSQNDCGCGGLSFSMMHSVGKMLPNEFIGADKILGVAFQPKTNRMLLSTNHIIYLYDFATRTILFHHKFSQYITDVIWTDSQNALITTSTDIYKGKQNIYQYSSTKNILRSLPRRPSTFHPVSGYWQPSYGA